MTEKNSTGEFDAKYVLPIGEDETLEAYYERRARFIQVFGPRKRPTIELTFEDQRVIAIREAIISTALQTTTYSTPEGKGMEPLS